MKTRLRNIRNVIQSSFHFGKKRGGRTVANFRWDVLRAIVLANMLSILTVSSTSAHPDDDWEPYYSWMWKNDHYIGNRPLSQILWPRTHDTLTWDPANFGFGARTQAMTLREQLDYGIRAFDLRFQYFADYKQYVGVHGPAIGDPAIVGMERMRSHLKGWLQRPDSSKEIVIAETWDWGCNGDGNVDSKSPNCPEANHDDEFCIGFYETFKDRLIPLEPANDPALRVRDNCPDVYNPDQFDEDRDGVGRLCDVDDDFNSPPSDSDGDSILDINDNCPTRYNQGQREIYNKVNDYRGFRGVGVVCEESGDPDEDSIPTYQPTDASLTLREVWERYPGRNLIWKVQYAQCDDAFASYKAQTGVDIAKYNWRSHIIDGVSNESSFAGPIKTAMRESLVRNNAFRIDSFNAIQTQATYGNGNLESLFYLAHVVGSDTLHNAYEWYRTNQHFAYRNLNLIGVDFPEHLRNSYDGGRAMEAPYWNRNYMIMRTQFVDRINGQLCSKIVEANDGITWIAEDCYFEAICADKVERPVGLVVRKSVNGRQSKLLEEAERYSQDECSSIDLSPDPDGDFKKFYDKGCQTHEVGLQANGLTNPTMELSAVCNVSGQNRRETHTVRVDSEGPVLHSMSDGYNGSNWINHSNVCVLRDEGVGLNNQDQHGLALFSADVTNNLDGTHTFTCGGSSRFADRVGNVTTDTESKIFRIDDKPPRVSVDNRFPYSQQACGAQDNPCFEGGQTKLNVETMIALGRLTVSDDKDPDPKLNCGPSLALGLNDAGCSAIDHAGNKSSVAMFRVNVVDSPPSLTVPANISREIYPGENAVVTFNVSATDPQGQPSVACSHSSGSVFPEGSTTVSCTATDSRNQKTTKTFSVIVHINQPPSAYTVLPSLVFDEGSYGIYNYTASDPEGNSFTVSPSCGLGSLVTSSGPNANGQGSFKCRFPDGDIADAAPGLTLSAYKHGDVQYNFRAEINNVVPSIILTENKSVARGEIVNIFGFWVDPALTADQPYTYSWKLDGGAPDQTGTAIYGSSISTQRSFPELGSYTVTFKVTDKDGGSSSKSMQIDVVNQTPVAVCEDKTVSGVDCKVPVLIDNGSYDPDDDTISLTYSPGPVYPVNTDTLVTLTVDDGIDEQGIAEAICTVSCVNMPPDAKADVGQLTNIGDVARVSLTGSSSSDYEDDIGDLSFNWSVDSQPVCTGGVECADIQTDLEFGRYQVTLTVTDTLGDSSSKTLEVVIDPASLSLVDCEKFEVEFCIEEDGSMHGNCTVDEFKANGEIGLPIGVNYMDLLASSDLSFLAGSGYSPDGFTNTTTDIAFEKKGKDGDHWKLFAPTGGIEKLEFDWKGAKFEFKEKHVPVEFESVLISSQATTLRVKYSRKEIVGAFTVNFPNHQKLIVDTTTNTTTTVPVIPVTEIRKNKEIEVELPFPLVLGDIISISGGASHSLHVSNYYTHSIGRFKFKGESNELLPMPNGAATMPRMVDIRFALGAQNYPGGCVRENADIKAKDRKWKQVNDSDSDSDSDSEK